MGVVSELPQQVPATRQLRKALLLRSRRRVVICVPNNDVGAEQVCGAPGHSFCYQRQQPQLIQSFLGQRLPAPVGLWAPR